QECPSYRPAKKRGGNPRNLLPLLLRAGTLGCVASRRAGTPRREFSSCGLESARKGSAGRTKVHPTSIGEWSFMLRPLAVACVVVFTAGLSGGAAPAAAQGLIWSLPAEDAAWVRFEGTFKDKQAHP